MIKSISDFCKKEENLHDDSIVGLSTSKNIDKSRHCYHVITQSWAKETIFYADVARYRQNLLCQLCVKNRIVIVYSTTNPNHTHEVFITPSWEILSSMIKSLNTNVSRYIRKHYENKGRKGRRIFAECPAYIPVDNIVHLFYLGKYIYDNPQYLLKEGKQIPDSCYWMFEKNHLKEPYDADLFIKLFGLNPRELFDIFSTKTKEQVLEYARQRFSNWTDDDNKRVFH